MPADHKVRVGWQIVFTFLPVVNFWAFYRIRRLRRYVLFIIVPQIAISAIIFSYMLDTTKLFSLNDATRSNEISNESQIALFAINYLGGIVLQGITIYLIIIWSRAHNRQFDGPTAHTAPSV